MNTVWRKQIPLFAISVWVCVYICTLHTCGKPGVPAAIAPVKSMFRWSIYSQIHEAVDGTALQSFFAVSFQLNWSNPDNYIGQVYCEIKCFACSVFLSNVVASYLQNQIIVWNIDSLCPMLCLSCCHLPSMRFLFHVPTDIGTNLEIIH